MKAERNSRTITRTIPLLMAACLIAIPSQAKYGGGSGTADDPYQIWTAEQMNAIGADPNDWDKHFKLMADIDLSAYDGQDGRPAFNLIAVYARTTVSFSGAFDGDGHSITNFTVSSSSQAGCVGLFRYISGRSAEIKDLRLFRPTLDARRTGTVGALAGYFEGGTITGCHVEDGAITGDDAVGALVGHLEDGIIRDCHVEDSAITGGDCVGGLVGDLRRGNVTECHVKDATIIGGHYFGGDRIGGLAGYLQEGTITDCHIENGTIMGGDYVGGLVGDCNATTTVECHATGVVIGNDHVGGLCGTGWYAVRCFATATVLGHDYVGGLLGNGSATNCYATGTVMGNNYVGGLAGYGRGNILSPDWPGLRVAIRNSYAACVVVGDAIAVDYPASMGDLVGSPPAGLPSFPVDTHAFVGGLVGLINDDSDVVCSFWDIGVSGQLISAGGQGRTTAQMQTAGTFLTWNADSNAGVWTIDEGRDYPRLAWEGRPGTTIGSGPPVRTGTRDNPYLIYTAEELWLLTKSPAEWDKCFKLMADLDLAEYAGTGLSSIGTGTQSFTGVFDGNGHTISGYVNTAAAGGHAGLFGYVYGLGTPEPEPANVVVIKDLGLIDPVIDGRTTNDTGALVSFFGKGVISGCYVERGLVVGDEAGGLVGYNGSTVRNCHASTRVISVTAGGLVARNRGDVINCYSTGVVLSADYTGGLAGSDEFGWGNVIASFWDIESSGQTTSVGGEGKTTAEMQMAKTFLDAGWDFAGETVNGTEDIWWIDEGKDYPRLWWEVAAE
jgi:hypothetical protein